jgi:D-glycero-D-manno-heptose 1,7-bisphosphate phosphatase
VFLDRDGVLNELVLRDRRLVSPRFLSDFRLVEDVANHLARLSSLSYTLVVVTNQPDIARGFLAERTLRAMNDQLLNFVDAVIVCPHDDEDECACRKPGSGMLRSAAADFRLDLDQSWMIGDRWVDLAAGLDAGCRTALVEHSQSWSGMPTALALQDHLDVRAESLGSVIDEIQKLISQE